MALEIKESINIRDNKLTNGLIPVFHIMEMVESSNEMVLDPEDDVAHVKLGGKWRMPTEAEWRELRNTDNCSWTWTTLKGVNGYKVTSKKNGNSIFLPAAGFRYRGSLDLDGEYGCYWSSSLSPYNPDYACRFDFGSFSVLTGFIDRYLGRSVRPVSE